jgi:hypothetical protein
MAQKLNFLLGPLTFCRFYIQLALSQPGKNSANMQQMLLERSRENTNIIKIRACSEVAQTRHV